MKKRSGFTFLFLWFSLCVFAQAGQLEFETASTEILNGDYSSAINRLDMIERSGYESGPLYLNLAIGYTALDSLGMAKAFFKKAMRFKETRPAAEKGLQFAENRLRYRTATLPELPWRRFFRWLNETAGPVWLLAGSAFLLNLAALILAISWFKGGWRKMTARLGPVLLAFSVFSGLSAWKLIADTQRYAEAVQIISETKILEKPEPDAILISNSFEGYEFVVDNAESRAADGWLYVRMSNGLYGWIPAHALKKL